MGGTYPWVNSALSGCRSFIIGHLMTGSGGQVAGGAYAAHVEKKRF